MPITDRVIETDKTHQRVEAEKGARGVALSAGRSPEPVSPALEREVALDLIVQLRDDYPSLHPFMAAAERVGGAEAKLRVAEAAGAPRQVLGELQVELTRAQDSWAGLPGPQEAEAEGALEAYARLLTIVARDPRASS
ncbi:MAG: hypothetical protein JWO68_2231 [Actinomycetia bacterium]|nr:hypothetical protein [Actinomycetes bacterium]